DRLPKFCSGGELEQETVTFLQENIRINTTNPPGNELPLAKLIKKKFDQEQNPLIKTKIIETRPNRGNLIVEIKGSDPENHPCWGFASHLDVVPAGNEDDWEYPPFSAEIVQKPHDEFIWGRGSFDMKQIGVSHTMAILTLLREGFHPKGNIKLIFESDEERGGEEGMGILVDEYWDEIKVDCFITEGAGFKLPTGKDFAIQIGEKGKCQTKLKFRGVAGHGSTPDPYEKFAIYKMVQVLNKIRDRKQKVYMIDEYKNTVNALSLPKIFKFLLKRKSIIKGLLSFLSKRTGDPFDKFFLPMITDTISPTIIKAGEKVNVISPHAELSLDIRVLPEHNHEFVYNQLETIFGKDLYNQIDLIPIDETESTTSPINTPYYKIIGETLEEIYSGANLIPLFDVGGTDMKHVRRKNIPCYGFSLILKDPDLTYDELGGMAHAPNERVSVTNLMLATEFTYRLMKKL
ncbi:MAG: M20/M25/M40 family metallo-hydrolase, partial [Candidatus Lokiarchaeota archaeon]|nr:M20/M25/M40 family metallo-hydrolase [Candidatus Lokiarchaeota archaeon]MBD3201966.1 M20/M25/M40 family metallo-hydrolase [Candidatus Lokiarchaeota archaeon]